MGLLESLGGAGTLLGGVSSLAGVIGAANDARRQQKARELAVQQYQTAGEQGLEGNYITGLKGLYSAGGIGGDALTNTVRNLGSNLAAAGVYNPGVVAGAALQGQQQLNSSIAGLADSTAARNTQGLAALNQDVANKRLGLSGENWYNSLNERNSAEGGLSNFLGSLSQLNLAHSGANTYRALQAPMNGTQGQATALPGVDINNYPGGTVPAPQNYSTPDMMMPRAMPLSISQAPYPNYRPTRGVKPSTALSFR